MARGSKKKYTDKQKRQAEHIEEGYKERGTSEDEAERRAWAEERHGDRYSRVADQYRAALVRLYGEEAGKKVKYAEAFEVCEYGRQPSTEELLRLFPFFPNRKQ